VYRALVLGFSTPLTRNAGHSRYIRDSGNGSLRVSVHVLSANGMTQEVFGIYAPNGFQAAKVTLSFSILVPVSTVRYTVSSLVPSMTKSKSETVLAASS